VSLLMLNKEILDGWGVVWDDAAIRTRGEMLARTRYLPTNQPANRPTDRGVLADWGPWHLRSTSTRGLRGTDCHRSRSA
jgi:hypothetical protein